MDYWLNTYDVTAMLQLALALDKNDSIVLKSNVFTYRVLWIHDINDPQYWRQQISQEE